MAQNVSVQYVRYYTSGSAARKLAPVVPIHTGALPRMTKRKVYRIAIDPVAVLGAAVAICMLVMMFAGVSTLRTEQQKTAEMAEYVEQLQAENAALQEQYTQACDLEKIEQTARALGMIPAEQAQNTTIEVTVPQEEAPAPNLWERIGMFLTGLFA